MRVLLKISGEALAGGEPSGLDYVMLDEVCDKIKDLLNNNVEI
jgi:uridylate kinase